MLAYGSKLTLFITNQFVMNNRLVKEQAVRHQVIRVERVRGLPAKAHQEETTYGAVSSWRFN